MAASYLAPSDSAGIVTLCPEEKATSQEDIAVLLIKLLKFKIDHDNFGGKVEDPHTSLTGYGKMM